MLCSVVSSFLYAAKFISFCNLVSTDLLSVDLVNKIVQVHLFDILRICCTVNSVDLNMSVALVKPVRFSMIELRIRFQFLYN
jgi:hypothetical protein